ncbi:hypothetical protein H2200_001739 [Cladophialophora chaetospira]|uniref:Uncharacterized protein n=1 Tax=Cladophialophora chaetospira TaxID=386627 RepID=A0AA38XLJ9_9EURO|nr:hypothetical protein H2200_001739 [Cladophialophora chaetospira]
MPDTERSSKILTVTVVTAATGEDGQHRGDAVTGEDNDQFDGDSGEWSQRMHIVPKSDEEEKADDRASDADQLETDTPETDDSYHGTGLGHLAGDAELVAQSFPAGTQTPPLEALQDGASPSVLLSFDSTQPDEHVTTNSAEPRELTLDLESEPEEEPEPEPRTVGRKSLKRKASDKLVGCKRRS